MNKQRMNIMIDYDVYLGMKSRNENISNIVNSLLKGFLQVESQNPDKDKVMREINDLKNKDIEIREQIAKAQMILYAIEEEEKKQQMDDFEKKKAMAKAMRNSDMLNRMMD